MIRTVAIALFLSAICITAARAAEPAATKPTVTRLAVGTAVEDRTLEGAAGEFTADVGAVWAHVTVENRAAPTVLTVIWRHGDEERARIDLDVGASPRWRTWARKRIRPRDIGRWQVEIRDAAGALLATESFVVLPAEKPARSG